MLKDYGLDSAGKHGNDLLKSKCLKNGSEFEIVLRRMRFN